jgi:predicted amidohydrolase
VLRTPGGNVGVALCWEFIRSQTAKRLYGKVDLVVGGSCWWTLSDDAPEDHPLRNVNLAILRETPARFARMLGVPVVHASHVGRFEGFWGPDLDDVPYDSQFLGETQIVDGQGRVIARMGLSDGEGFVIADIRTGRVSGQQELIPDRFWVPEELPEPWRESWERWLRRGPQCFEETTKPYLSDLRPNMKFNADSLTSSASFAYWRAG